MQKELPQTSTINTTIQNEEMQLSYLRKELELLKNGLMYLDIVRLYQTINTTTQPSFMDHSFSSVSNAPRDSFSNKFSSNPPQLSLLHIDASSGLKHLHALQILRKVRLQNSSSNPRCTAPKKVDESKHKKPIVTKDYHKKNVKKDSHTPDKRLKFRSPLESIKSRDDDSDTLDDANESSRTTNPNRNTTDKIQIKPRIPEKRKYHKRKLRSADERKPTLRFSQHTNDSTTSFIKAKLTEKQNQIILDNQKGNDESKKDVANMMDIEKSEPLQIISVTNTTNNEIDKAMDEEQVNQQNENKMELIENKRVEGEQQVKQQEKENSKGPIEKKNQKDKIPHMGNPISHIIETGQSSSKIQGSSPPKSITFTFINPLNKPQIKEKSVTKESKSVREKRNKKLDLNEGVDSTTETKQKMKEESPNDNPKTGNN
ncbi:hypothetical protein QTN25_007069 [Entamoeba marina]